MLLLMLCRETSSNSVQRSEIPAIVLLSLNRNYRTIKNRQLCKVLLILVIVHSSLPGEAGTSYSERFIPLIKAEGSSFISVTSIVHKRINTSQLKFFHLVPIISQRQYES